MTTDAYLERIELIKKHNILTITKVTDCTDIEKLGERIIEYADYCVFVSGKPAKLGSLNRIFGRTANKLGTTARELVEALSASGKARVFQYQTSAIILSQAFCADQEARFGDDFDGLEQARERMFSRAE